MRYFIRSAYHDWSEVDRVTFDKYKEKILQRFAEAQRFDKFFERAGISEDEFIKRYTKTEE